MSKRGFPFTAGITTASMDDSRYIPILKHENPTDCKPLANLGHVSADQQLTFFRESVVKNITPFKANIKSKT